MDTFTARLRASLTDAMRKRDEAAVAAIRSTLAAIANAEAIAAPITSTPRIGVGAGEAARRELSEEDVLNIIRTEIAERAAAAEEYERVGRTENAGRLRAQAAALEPYV